MLRRRAVFHAGLESAHTVHARIRNHPTIRIEDGEMLPVLETNETMTIEEQVREILA